MLRETEYQEIIISKIFKIINTNHGLSQSLQTQVADIQELEIRMIINLPLTLKFISEKLWYILRSHKIRSFFCTKNTLCKPLCKPKDRVATEDKSYIVYEKECRIITLVGIKRKC